MSQIGRDRIGQRAFQEYSGMGNPKELEPKGYPLALEHRKSHGEVTDTLGKF